MHRMSFSVPRHVCTIIVAALAIITAGVHSASAELRAKPVGSNGLRALIPGSVVHLDTPVGTVVPVRYAPDGTMRGAATGVVASYLGAAADKGHWWIDRGKLCHKWSVWFKARTGCMRVRRAGRRVFWRDDKGDTGTATIAALAPRKRAPARKPKPNLKLAEAAPVQIVRPQPPRPEKKRETSPEPERVKPAQPTQPWPEPTVRPAPEPTVPRQTMPLMASALSQLQVAPPSSQPMGLSAPPLPTRLRKHERVEPADARGPTFRVIRVRADDVLNIRQEPSNEAIITGAIAPDGRGIRITGTCVPEWCPVAHVSGTGWVHRFYIAAERRPDRRAEVEETARPAASRWVTVMPGDTLVRLARLYQVPLRQIMTVNALPTSRIRAGQTLVIP